MSVPYRGLTDNRRFRSLARRCAVLEQSDHSLVLYWPHNNGDVTFPQTSEISVRDFVTYLCRTIRRHGRGPRL